MGNRPAPLFELVRVQQTMQRSHDTGEQMDCDKKRGHHPQADEMLQAPIWYTWYHPGKI